MSICKDSGGGCMVDRGICSCYETVKNKSGMTMRTEGWAGLGPNGTGNTVGMIQPLNSFLCVCVGGCLYDLVRFLF